LKRQIQYHLVAEQRLEVEEVALQPTREVIIWLDARIDEQLLNVDFKLAGDFTEAPYALSAKLDSRRAGDQHPFDD
jgi:hypothetical protein